MPLDVFFLGAENASKLFSAGLWIQWSALPVAPKIMHRPKLNWALQHT